MPTYEFRCDKCNKSWSEQQSMNQEHLSKCPKCQQECKNIAFGGTGFQFAGRLLNKQLHGFPDYENKTNKKADKEGEEMEKDYDTYVKERLRKESKESEE